MNDTTSNSTPSTDPASAHPEGSLAAMVEALNNAVTECGTLLFSLPAGGPTIESLKAQYPNMVVIAHVGISYCVSLPVSEWEIRMNSPHLHLPDPTAEDSDELKATAEARLRKGFFV
jgi:hypothetical protein